MDTLIKNLSAIVGEDNVLSKADELLVYECDGLPHHKHRPRAVVFPASTEQTSAVMKELARAQVPFTPRGAGTGLSGGALAMNQGVVVELARMRQILKIDPVNQLAVVQPGVVNLHVSRAVAPYGLYYVPDPSSQPTCTIGGNIAEGAGGIHCLKYGTTTDHVLGCVVVLAGGEVVQLGGAGIESHGYDLLGTFIGSEGTFGIATEATLRLVQTPPSVRTLLAEFGEVNDASHAVSAIIAAGVMPAALEMMDHEIIRAVEASVFAAGLPPDAGAALLIELDGIDAGLDDEAARVTDICMEYGARTCRAARDEAERKKLWAARKGAFGAIGRISPDSMIQDAVVPRSRLPEVLSSAYDIAHKYDLRLANVFHAGDGNLHPLICFDSRSADQVRRVKEAGRELMEVCVAAGGTITGEHGVGLDKRELLPLVFSEADMNAMLQLRLAFDPIGLCNPGKIVPMLRGCGEGRAIAIDTEPETDFESHYIYTHRTVIRKPQNIRTSFGSDSRANYLAELVGDNNVQIDGQNLVVCPGSVEEIQELTALAMVEGWTITPAGNRTWLSNSTEPKLVVSTSRLDRIKEHEPADLIAIAEAGVTLQSFNEQLSKNGQWLPLDPPDNGRATLGGVVATGLGGAQQFAYGRPRGSVIGMKVALGGGDLIKAGGRVVKNVAGYDLCKLFTGSYGTLGIITEVTFKLRPKPAIEQTILLTGTVQDLIKNGRAIVEMRLFPVGLELVSSAVAKELGLTVPSAHSALLVRFAGNEKGVKFQTQQAISIFAENRSEVIRNDVRLWETLAGLPLRDSNNRSWRASVLPDRADKLIENLSKICKRDFNELHWQLGIADGRFRMMTDGQDTPEAQATVGALGGNFFIEDPILAGRTTSSLMTRVKKQLDPFGIFDQQNEV